MKVRERQHPLVAERHISIPDSAGWPRSLTERQLHALFGAYCVVVGIVRFWVLVSTGTPAGVDGGNWLSFGHALLGDGFRPTSMVYPPIVPVIVTALVHILGPVTGIAVVAAVASLAPAVSVYAVLSSIGLRGSAVVLAGFLVPAAAMGEAAAWGGYPQLLGTGLAVFFLWKLDRFLRAGGRRDGLVAGGWLAGVFATSHFAALGAVIAGLVVFGFHLLGDATANGGIRLRRHVPRIALLAVPLLPIIPLYLSLVSEVAPNFNSRPEFVRLGLDDVVPKMAFMLREFPLFWWTALTLGVGLLVLLRRRWRSPEWVLPAALLLAVAAVAVGTREARQLYLLPPAIVMALAVGTDELTRRQKRAAVGLLAVALLLQSIVGLRMFPSQRDSYKMLTPGVVAAIEWLLHETPEGAVVAVSPLRDSPLGWWVEGLGRRRVLPGAALRFLYFDDEQVRAQAANRIFEAGWTHDFPDRESMALARQAGVDYVLAAKAWQGYSDSATDRFRRLQPGAVAFENDDVVVLRAGGERRSSASGSALTLPRDCPDRRPAAAEGQVRYSATVAKGSCHEDNRGT